MTRIYKGFAIAVASTSVMAIIGSISPAQAYLFFSDRPSWEAALKADLGDVTAQTLDFGESRSISNSGTTVFPNGVSVSTDVYGGSGIVSAGGTTVGAVHVLNPSSGSVGGRINFTLPSPVNALGYNVSVGPENGSLNTEFILEAGEPLSPRGNIGMGTITPGFVGIISQPSDPLISGFNITNLHLGTGFFNASNITIAKVPEASSTLGLLMAVGTFAARSVFLHRQKQQKSTTAIH